jgi:hypothetical protein
VACFISIQDVLTPRDEPLQQDKVKDRICKRKRSYAKLGQHIRAETTKVLR